MVELEWRSNLERWATFHDHEHNLRSTIAYNEVIADNVEVIGPQINSIAYTCVPVPETGLRMRLLMTLQRLWEDNESRRTL